MINIDLIHVSFAKIYKFGGLTFEDHAWCGPQPLRRSDLEMLSMSSMSARRWADYSKWFALDDDEREKYRIN